MRRRVFRWLSLFVFVCFATAVFSQEGHPLTGTWSGDWGPTSTQRTHITFVMNWDGKNVTGLMNPGPNSTPLGSVVLDPTNWTVRLEADAKDAAGKTVHISAEGKIEELGSYHRRIVGVWREGAASGDFRISRD